MTPSALLDALDRTLLLMRDDLVCTVDDTRLIAALAETSVALVASESDLQTHSAQCAYITAALSMVRSAHRVSLIAPNVLFAGAQPPLVEPRLIDALVEIGCDLVPGFSFDTAPSTRPVDLAIIFGAGGGRINASRLVYVNAGAWSAHLRPAEFALPWQGDDWPIGGLAAGTLAASEAFKCSMRKLREFAANPEHFDQLFAPADRVDLAMASALTPRITDLTAFDLISGGAISHGLLYCLARLPRVHGDGRVVDSERLELPNINRYALMRRSDIGALKTHQLSGLLQPDISLVSVPARYLGEGIDGDRLRLRVLVGVDDIPTRWRVQEDAPEWLGIGATTHWSAMASYHVQGLGCARCLHPRDEVGPARIPTAPFVSLQAGLHLACYFVTGIAGQLAKDDQYVYGTPLRPERLWRSPVGRRLGCPTCSGVKIAA